MGIPYMPLYVADYLGDTTHLTCEQHGAYLKLLMCLWRSDGVLPLDEAKITRMVGVTPARWAKMGADVMAFFQADETTFWSKRLNAELEKTDEYVEQKRAAGRASADAKRLKTHEADPTAGSTTRTRVILEPDLFGDSIDPTPVPLTPREVAEAVWSETPAVARGRSSKGNLERALIAATNRGQSLEAIRAALRTYYDSPDATKEGGKYAKGVHRMVEADRWENFSTTAEVFQIARITNPHERQQRGWMESWIEDAGSWKRYDRGPEPDEPGCQISPKVMAEFGYTPPERKAR